MKCDIEVHFTFFVSIVLHKHCYLRAQTYDSGGMQDPQGERIEPPVVCDRRRLSHIAQMNAIVHLRLCQAEAVQVNAMTHLRRKENGVHASGQRHIAARWPETEAVSIRAKARVARYHPVDSIRGKQIQAR